MKKDNKITENPNSKDKQDENRTNTKKLIIWGLAGAAIVVLLCFWFLNTMLCTCFIDLETKGQIGNSFGILGTLFTGLALVGVIVAAIQQNEIIRLQKNENDTQKQNFKEQYDLQKQEIESQKDNFEKQISIQRKKAFESTYFLLLDKLRTERDFFYYKDDKPVSYKGLKGMYKVQQSMESSSGVEYSGILEKSSIGSYVSLLLLICEKIESDVCFGENEKEKKYYMNLLRVQLTRVECCVLFYYRLTYGYYKTDSLGMTIKLWNYIKEYKLLEHLSYKDFEKYQIDKNTWKKLKDEVIALDEDEEIKTVFSKAIPNK